MKIKKGDQIIVTIGKDKGHKGKVDAVDVKNAMVFVPGLNIYKKHEKKRDEKRQGGIIEYARPFPTGKVALVCPKCGHEMKTCAVITDPFRIH